MTTCTYDQDFDVSQYADRVAMHRESASNQDLATLSLVVGDDHVHSYTIVGPRGMIERLAGEMTRFVEQFCAAG